MDQQPGYTDMQFPYRVYWLKRALYGLKQAPRAWFQCFSSFLMNLGFLLSQADSFLFIHHTMADTIYLLLYVDDMVLLETIPIWLKLLLHDCLKNLLWKIWVIYTVFLVLKSNMTLTAYFLTKPSIVLISYNMLIWLRPNPLPLFL